MATFSPPGGCRRVAPFSAGGMAESSGQRNRTTAPPQPSNAAGITVKCAGTLQSTSSVDTKCSKSALWGSELTGWVSQCRRDIASGEPSTCATLMTNGGDQVVNQLARRSIELSKAPHEEQRVSLHESEGYLATGVLHQRAFGMARAPCRWPRMHLRSFRPQPRLPGRQHVRIARSSKAAGDQAASPPSAAARRSGRHAMRSCV